MLDAIGELHPDPLIGEILLRRGLNTAAVVNDFLDTRPRPTPEPGLLPGMDAAVERVANAIESGERIAIFGDYDVDGITSVAVLSLALRSAMGDHSRVTARLPRRDEGYGLNAATVTELAATGAKLLIAVDCGSSNYAEVAVARAAGMDVVVLDHHQMTGQGPEGAIIASARLAEEPDHQFEHLTAAGLAYLLVVGLARHGCDVVPPGGSEADFLDLVALGTIADVAPLIGINRSLVSAGIARANRRPRLGFASLLKRIGIEPGQLTSSHVAFKVAPRLNAAGRIDDPQPALDLLTTSDPIEAEQLAQRIEFLNGQRRFESRRIEDEVDQVLAKRADLDTARILIVSGHGWRQGLVGIVASRLAERYGRPAIVLHDDGELSRGSARSVRGLDIHAALESCNGIIEHHGGHSQAAGLAVRSDRVPDLERQLEATLAKSEITLPIEPELGIDAELPASRLSLKTVEALQQLEPFGSGNEVPVFLIRDLAVRKYDTMGADRSHLRFDVSVAGGTVKVVMWGAADRSRELFHSRRIDLVATLEIDHWNGNRRLMVQAEDFRPSA